MVEQTVGEMKRAVRQGRQETVQAMATEKMIAKKLEEKLREARDWETKAMLALKSGDEELAREALKRKRRVEAESNELEGQRAEAAKFVDDLRSRIEEAERKVVELENTKAAVAARVRSARRPAGASAGSGRSAAMDRFDNLSSRIETMEAEVEAAAAIDDRPSEADLERRFARLERTMTETDGLDDELAELKKKLQ
jgi:phage shock protein A